MSVSGCCPRVTTPSALAFAIEVLCYRDGVTQPVAFNAQLVGGGRVEVLPDGLLKPLLPERTQCLAPLGRRFSERIPALAPFLADPGQDPACGALLGRLSRFFTGRLRQKLADELPS